MRTMGEFIRKFEKMITSVLIVMLAITVTLSVANLVWLLIKDILTPPILLLETNELLELFGLFLLILIGIELLETLTTYVHKREIRTEVIILVALIALGRKIVILDVKDGEDILLLGLAAVILALAIAYYLISRTHSSSDEHLAAPSDETVVKDKCSKVST